jgi:hypothetical protein
MRLFGCSLAAILLSASPAFACLCPLGLPAYELGRADAVFTARVIALRLIDAPIPAVRVELKALERLKGDVPEGMVFMRGQQPTRATFSHEPDPITGGVVVTMTGGAITDSCEFDDLFALGKEYVVAAFRNGRDSPYAVDLPEARWVTHFCAATRERNSDDGRRYLAGFREILKNSAR